jgi:ankyrin repeat protein
MFRNLPTDLQREICKFLKHSELYKASPVFLYREDDVFWKEKLLFFKQEIDISMSYQEQYIRYKFGILRPDNYWYIMYLRKAVDDDIFLKKYVDIRDSDGNTALMRACIYGYPLFIEKLLDAGADATLINPSGKNALILLVTKKVKKSVIHRLAYSCDVNYQIPGGDTALIITSIFSGSVGTIQILLNAGANINHQNSQGRTALMYAVNSDNKRLVRMLLLNNNIDASLKDKGGNTACEFIRWKNTNKITKYFHYYGKGCAF